MFRSAVHTLMFLSVVSLAFLGTPACGGGGGGGGGPQSLPVTFTGVYEFGIDETENDPPITAAFVMGAGDHALTVSHGAFGVGGSFDAATREWTIAVLSSWFIDTDQGTDPLFGAFSVNVESALVIPYKAPPTSGTLVIANPGPVATIEFVPGGINLSIPPLLPVFYDWEDFEDLVDTGSPVEQVASFALQVMRFITERYDQVVDLFFSLANVSDFESGYNPREFTGATWPTGYTLIPDTIDNPGQGSLLWDDSNNFDNEVGMGDDFSWAGWELRPDSSTDWAYDGSISFENLIALIDPFTNEVLGFGFRSIPGDRGGVIFNSLRLMQMDIDDGAMTVTHDNTVTMTGGFAIEFWKP